MGNQAILNVKFWQSGWAKQQVRTEALALRNAKMTAEVLALKSDTSAFESRARSELGMVKEGEVFYLTPETQE